MTTIYTFIPALAHQFPDHPESPARLDLLDFVAFPGLQQLPASAAKLDEIGRVHTPGMIRQLEEACALGPGIIDYAPTFVTVKSFDAALSAAGAALAATRAVLSGQAQNAFAIVRPPGHHAEPARAMGFCLFNNIAIAAQDALARGLERVLVVDYDVHHGNGTEKACWDDARAGYFSTHQENIYPGSGGLQDAPHARGRIADFPLPSRTGDDDFVQIFEQALTPLVKTFRPQLLLVSAGFDAHWSDPLASLGLSTNGFYRLSQRLVGLAAEHCSGKIVFVLEGGYEPQNVKNGVGAVFAALTGAEPPAAQDQSPYPEPDIQPRIEAFKKWHGLE
jgi:acetoin utilization deacetylase AcuC-like enzyme